MSYPTLVDVAEALVEKEIELLSFDTISEDQEHILRKFHDKRGMFFPGYGLDGNEVRVWFCLFVHEATKGIA